MTLQYDEISTDAVIAQTRRVLTESGYVDTSNSLDSDDIAATALFEDQYGLVGIFAYDTVDRLIGHWRIAQQKLAAIITAYWSKGEPKTWEGYLTLISVERTTSPSQSSNFQ